MVQPTEVHWQTVKRILRYIAGTLDHGLEMRPSPSLCLNAFSDSIGQGAQMIGSQHQGMQFI
jgi:hypothetical protein